MVWFLCRHFLYLLFYRFVISRSFHIADYPKAMGKSGPSINANFNCKVWSSQWASVYKDIALRNAVFTQFTTFSPKPSCIKPNSRFGPKKHRFAMFQINGIAFPVFFFRYGIVRAIIKDNAILQHFHYRSTFVTGSCLQHLDRWSAIYSCTAGKKASTGTKGKALPDGKDLLPCRKVTTY